MLSNIKYHIVQKVSRQLNRLKKPPKGDFNMASEDFYKKIYLDNILFQISDNFSCEKSLKILDGGCGTGRIGIELAKTGHDVTGIDYHQPSLDLAKINAKKARVSLKLIQADLLKYLKSLESNSYDICLCLEVLYVCVEYKDIIKEYYRVIKNKGLFIASFRSKFYFITTLLLQKQYAKALYVAENSEGLLKISLIPAYYNWQSLYEVNKLYVDNNFKLIKVVPIGMFSGFAYDGTSAIANLEKIPEDVLNSVFYKIETSKLEDCRGIGRYMLAIGKK